MKNLRMQQEMTDRGRLEIRVNTRIQARPVSGARVTVSYTGDPQNVIEELITDGDGRTETLDLATPPLEYSLEPNVNQPYSEYTVKVEARLHSLVLLIRDWIEEMNFDCYGTNCIGVKRNKTVF